MRCERLHDSGAYVLGAMLPPEREAYDRHLRDCATCRAEVAELAVLPGLLGRLDLPTAQAIAAGGEDAMHAVVDALPGVDVRAGWTGPMAWDRPTVGPDGSEQKRDPLLPRLLDRVNAHRRADRRRHRWQIAGAALVAACLGVFAVFGVRAAGIGAPATPDYTAMRQVVANLPVTASLALEPLQGGTRVQMLCKYKPGAGEGRWTFRLVAIPKTGDAQELNSWTAGFGDEYQLTGHTSLKRDEIQRVELRNKDGTPLLVYEVP